MQGYEGDRKEGCQVLQCRCHPEKCISGSEVLHVTSPTSVHYTVLSTIAHYVQGPGSGGPLSTTQGAPPAMTQLLALVFIRNPGCNLT